MAQRRHRARQMIGAVLGAGLAALTAMAAATPLAATEAADGDPDWDQVANIKEAANHLAELQRTRGATKAFEFIDACYKTHSLSSKYTRAFEACIAQDYMETQVLALVYSRIPVDTLNKLRAPTPELLAKSMSLRVAQAFANYKVPAARVQAFKKLVDEHGFPVFFTALFPGVKVPVLKKAPKGGPEQDAPADAAPETNEKK